jgi:hypothetical protein
MRRLGLLLAPLCGALVLGLTAGDARAGVDVPGLQTALLSLIADAQKGVCGPQLAPLVATSCQQQIGGLSKRLQGMGRPLGATFQGVDSQGSVFLVRFERGSMTWLIAKNPAGQVTVFWTP